MNVIDAGKIAEHVSRDLDIPIAEQVTNPIEMWLLSGAIRAGDRFPTVRDLAESLSVCHKTAQRCQAAVRKKGLIVIEGNRAYCASLKGAKARTAKKRYERLAMSGILAFRETGADKARIAEMVEDAYRMERGPYAAV